MTDYKYENDFLSGGGETYDSIPSGDFRPLTNIGLAKTFRAWAITVGKGTEFDDEGEYTNGKSRRVTPGPLWLPGDKEIATTYVKKYMSETRFPPTLTFVTMAVVSVKNMSEESRDKFMSKSKTGVLSGSCPVVGLGSKKHGAGLNLVALPSMVDAYARGRGWYTDPLFDLGLVGGGSNIKEDTDDQIAKLIAQRTVIWTALGAKDDDWKVNNVKELPQRLAEAIDRMANESWKPTWIRMATVPDPSPGAFYRKDVEKDGLVKNEAFRNQVQVVVEFFPNERVAQETGLKELAAQSSGGTVASENGSEGPSLFDALSANAQGFYGDAQTFAQVLPDVRKALDSNASLAQMSKDYGLTPADVKAIRG